MTKWRFFILLLVLPLKTYALTYDSLHSELGGDELVFISHHDHDGFLLDAESVDHLRGYHNQYLREPLYDDYLHNVLIQMIGLAGFKHLFKNLGGGFVPIKIENDHLIMKGTQDHCGGMEEAMVLVRLNSGDVTSLLYSQESFIIHSTLPTSDQLPADALKWIKHLINAYGSRNNPTRNKVQLRKMAGDWCRGYTP